MCYAFRNENGQLEAPFLEYLEKYALTDRDSKKKKTIKLKQLANVESHLDYLAEHGGRYDLPPLAEKYKNRNFGILKIKESARLVRIVFFTKVGSKIVLLDTMDKPKLYEKARKQKVDRMIEKFLDQAEQNRQDYIKNNLSLPLTRSIP